MQQGKCKDCAFFEQSDTQKQTNSHLGFCNLKLPRKYTLEDTWNWQRVDDSCSLFKEQTTRKENE